jgi:hypothetical protein
MPYLDDIVLLLLPLLADTEVRSISLSFLLEFFSLLFADLAGSMLNGVDILKAAWEHQINNSEHNEKLRKLINFFFVNKTMMNIRTFDGLQSKGDE